MNILDLVVKPQLTEVIIDDVDVIEKYGETITFYMYDQLDINTYFAFFRAQHENDADKLSSLLKSIILNQEGKPVIDAEHELPIDIFAAAVVKITEILGKSVTKNSKQKETGTPQ